jgi:lipopolysaccharide export system protein LptA
MRLTLLFLLSLFIFMAAPLYAETTEAFVPAPPHAAVEKADAKKQAPSGGLLGSGKPGETLEITADQSLEWHEEERFYIAKGNAKATRGAVTVSADTLKAFDRKKPDGSSEVWKMTAEGHVKITSEKRQATGDKGEYNIDTHKMVLTGEHLTYTSAEETVTAKESLEYWENENMALAKGDAYAKRDNREVRAEELRLYFKTNKKGEQVVDRMEAKGNVSITTDADAVSCDTATYNPIANTAQLVGHVNITRGSNQLKGDKAEANFNTGVSKIINTGSGRVHALVLASPGGKKTAK